MLRRTSVSGRCSHTVPRDPSILLKLRTSEHGFGSRIDERGSQRGILVKEPAGRGMADGAGSSAEWESHPLPHRSLIGPLQLYRALSGYAQPCAPLRTRCNHLGLWDVILWHSLRRLRIAQSHDSLTCRSTRLFCAYILLMPQRGLARTTRSSGGPELHRD